MDGRKQMHENHLFGRGTRGQIRPLIPFFYQVPCAQYVYISNVETIRSYKLPYSLHIGRVVVVVRGGVGEFTLVCSCHIDVQTGDSMRLDVFACQKLSVSVCY